MKIILKKQTQILKVIEQTLRTHVLREINFSDLKRI